MLRSVSSRSSPRPRRRARRCSISNAGWRKRATTSRATRPGRTGSTPLPQSATSRSPGGYGWTTPVAPRPGGLRRGRLPARRPAALRAAADAPRMTWPTSRRGSAISASSPTGSTASSARRPPRPSPTSSATSGLTADGICGPDTVAALHRVRRRTPPSVKAVVEREQLRSGLARRPAAASCRPARRSRRAGHHGHPRPPGPGRGRRRLDDPDLSAQAAEANGFQADVYLGVDLLDGPGCRCSYYGRPDYESAGGRRLAERLAEVLPDALDGTAGTTHPMQLPVLRETRMVAVWCEITLGAVVEATAATRRWCGAASTGLRHRSRVDPHLRLTTAFFHTLWSTPGCWIRSPACSSPADPLEVLEAREVDHH